MAWRCLARGAPFSTGYEAWYHASRCPAAEGAEDTLAGATGGAAKDPSGRLSSGRLAGASSFVSDEGRHAEAPASGCADFAIEFVIVFVLTGAGEGEPLHAGSPEAV